MPPASLLFLKKKKRISVSLIRLCIIHTYILISDKTFLEQGFQHNLAFLTPKCLIYFAICETNIMKNLKITAVTSSPTWSFVVGQMLEYQCYVKASQLFCFASLSWVVWVKRHSEPLQHEMSLQCGSSMKWCCEKCNSLERRFPGCRANPSRQGCNDLWRAQRLKWFIAHKRRSKQLYG